MLTRRRATAISGFLCSLVLAGLPAVASAQTGDSADGRVSTNLGSSVVFHVEGDATGAHPTGHFSEEGPLGTWDATPRCMNAAGDRASLGFAIESGSSAGRELRGHGLLLWIHEVAGGGTIYGKVTDPGQPVTCPDPRQGADPSLDAIGVGGYVYATDNQPPAPAAGDTVQGGVSRCLIQYPGQSWCDLSVSFTVLAASGPSGERRSGEISLYQTGQTPGAGALAIAAVTCLSVTGHTAIIGVTGSRHRFGASEAVFPFSGLVRVADTVRFAVKLGDKNGLPLQGPTTCSTFPGGFTTGNFQFPDFPNQAGDVAVSDLPPPTTYAQCRRAGWQTFGAFTSQAGCLAAVHDRAQQACVFERAAHGTAAFRLKYGRPSDHQLAMSRCVRQQTGS